MASDKHIFVMFQSRSHITRTYPVSASAAQNQLNSRQWTLTALLIFQKWDVQKMRLHLKAIFPFWIRLNLPTDFWPTNLLFRQPLMHSMNCQGNHLNYLIKKMSGLKV